MAARRRLIGLALAAGALGLAVLAYRQWRLPSPPAPADVRASTGDAQEAPLPALGSSAGAAAATDCSEGGARDARPAADAEAREQQAEQALRAIALGLAASAAAADRATGLYVQMVDAGQAARTQFAGQNPQCATDDSCGRREDAALLQAERPVRDALARLAATSNDVPAYHLAYLACGAVEAVADKGECAQLSARQWTRLEPDNALAWLFAAGEAARQAQPALVDEALYRAAHAPRLDSHWSTFARLLDADALHNADEDARAAVAADVLGRVAATRFAPFQPVFDHCSAGALADPNRRQVCDDLARLLTERSDTTISMLIGTKLAQALGWPQDKLDALRDRRDAYFQVVLDSAVPAQADCAARGRQRRFLEAMLRHGEVDAARREIAARGLSVAELAQRRRSEMRSQRREGNARGDTPAPARPPAAQDR